MQRPEALQIHWVNNRVDPNSHSLRQPMKRVLKRLGMSLPTKSGQVDPDDFGALNHRTCNEDGTAVKDPHWVIHPGERLWCRGPNGSGKTHFFRQVAGLVPAPHLRIWVGPQEISGLPVHRRRIGYLFQNHPSLPGLNVAGQIVFGLQMCGLKSSQVRELTNEWLERVELLAYRNQSPSSLSGGQRQRLGWAQILAPRPRVLLLDEPLSAQDQYWRGALVKLLTNYLQEWPVPTLWAHHAQSAPAGHQDVQETDAWDEVGAGQSTALKVRADSLDSLHTQERTFAREGGSDC